MKREEADKKTRRKTLMGGWVERPFFVLRLLGSRRNNVGRIEDPECKNRSDVVSDSKNNIIFEILKRTSFYTIVRTKMNRTKNMMESKKFFLSFQFFSGKNLVS